MAARRPPLPPWKVALGLGAALFLLDACLVPPFVGWYDTGELLAATAALGISHPSGQVLYHLLGKCFLAIPFGDPPWRLGLLSAAAGALASSLFFLLACRLGERLSPHPDRPLSPTLRLWLSALTLAWSLSLPWWTYAVTQLVYSLHLALILGVLWIVSSRHPRKWQGAALVLGAAVVFRPTQFFGLACLGALYFHETRRRRAGRLRRLAVVASFFLLGWSTALYLPLRSALHPAIAFAALDHPAALLRQLLALKFSSSLGSASPGTMAVILGQMGRRFWDDLTPLGCLLSASGIFLAWRLRARMPAFFWAGAAWALLEALLVVSVPYPTFESHQFLYPWAFLGLAAAVALAWLSHLEMRLDGRGLHRVLAWKKALPLLLGFWVLAQLSQVGVPWERRQERGAQDFARDVLDTLGRGALYAPSEENQYFPVVGYQLGFGVRPDVEILEPGKDPHDQVGEELRSALLAGRPVFLNRPIEGIAPGWRFQPEGPLLQITRDPAAEPLGAKAASGKALAAWGGLRLLFLRPEPASVTAGGRLQLNYGWERLRASPADGAQWVGVYFTDPAGNYPLKDGLLWFHDIHAPFGGGESFGALAPGRAFGETRILFVPSDIPPGRYRVWVALQKPGQAPRTGQESFQGDFYDRAGAEDLEKFAGRPGEGFVAQYAPVDSRSAPSDFLPLASPGAKDGVFAPAGEIEVRAPGAP